MRVYIVCVLKHFLSYGMKLSPLVLHPFYFRFTVFPIVRSFKFFMYSNLSLFSFMIYSTASKLKLLFFHKSDKYSIPSPAGTSVIFFIYFLNLLEGYFCIQCKMCLTWSFPKIIIQLIWFDFLNIFSNDLLF